MYGKQYVGMARTTFLIRPDGTIGRVWERVKAEETSSIIQHILAQPWDS